MTTSADIQNIPEADLVRVMLSALDLSDWNETTRAAARAEEAALGKENYVLPATVQGKNEQDGWVSFLVYMGLAAASCVIATLLYWHETKSIPALAVGLIASVVIPGGIVAFITVDAWLGAIRNARR